MQIVIEIPESVKQAFDKATKDDICGGYYDCNGIIGKAIQNGVPLPKVHSISLDVVLQEIRQDIDKWHHLTDKAFNDGIDTALEIIDAHIKECSE